MDAAFSNTEKERVLLAYYLGRQKLLSCIALCQLTTDIIDAIGQSPSNGWSRRADVITGCCLCKEKEVIFKDLWEYYHDSNCDSTEESYGVSDEDVDNAWDDIINLWHDVETQEGNAFPSRNNFLSFEEACQSVLEKHEVYIYSDIKRKNTDVENFRNWSLLIESVKNQLRSCHFDLWKISANCAGATTSFAATDSHLTHVQSNVFVKKNPKLVTRFAQNCRTYGVEIKSTDKPCMISVKYAICSKCIPWQDQRNVSILELLSRFHEVLGRSECPSKNLMELHGSIYNQKKVKNSKRRSKLQYASNLFRNGGLSPKVLSVMKKSENTHKKVRSLTSVKKVREIETEAPVSETSDYAEEVTSDNDFSLAQTAENHFKISPTLTRSKSLKKNEDEVSASLCSKQTVQSPAFHSGLNFQTKASKHLEILQISSDSVDSVIVASEVPVGTNAIARSSSGSHKSMPLKKYEGFEWYENDESENEGKDPNFMPFTSVKKEVSEIKIEPPVLETEDYTEADPSDNYLLNSSAQTVENPRQISPASTRSMILKENENQGNQNVVSKISHSKETLQFHENNNKKAFLFNEKQQTQEHHNRKKDNVTRLGKLKRISLAAEKYEGFAWYESDDSETEANDPSVISSTSLGEAGEVKTKPPPLETDGHAEGVTSDNDLLFPSTQTAGNHRQFSSESESRGSESIVSTSPHSKRILQSQANRSGVNVHTETIKPLEIPQISSGTMDPESNPIIPSEVQVSVNAITPSSSSNHESPTSEKQQFHEDDIKFGFHHSSATLPKRENDKNLSAEKAFPYIENEQTQGRHGGKKENSTRLRKSKRVSRAAKKYEGFVLYESDDSETEANYPKRAKMSETKDVKKGQKEEIDQFHAPCDGKRKLSSCDPDSALTAQTFKALLLNADHPSQHQSILSEKIQTYKSSDSRAKNLPAVFNYMPVGSESKKTLLNYDLSAAQGGFPIPSKAIADKIIPHSINFASQGLTTFTTQPLPTSTDEKISTFEKGNEAPVISWSTKSTPINYDDHHFILNAATGGFPALSKMNYCEGSINMHKKTSGCDSDASQNFKSSSTKSSQKVFKTSTSEKENEFDLNYEKTHLTKGLATVNKAPINGSYNATFPQSPVVPAKPLECVAESSAEKGVVNIGRRESGPNEKPQKMRVLKILEPTTDNNCTLPLHKSVITPAKPSKNKAESTREKGEFESSSYKPSVGPEIKVTGHDVGVVFSTTDEPAKPCHEGRSILPCDKTSLMEWLGDKVRANLPGVEGELNEADNREMQFSQNLKSVKADEVVDDKDIFSEGIKHSKAVELNLGECTLCFPNTISDQSKMPLEGRKHTERGITLPRKRKLCIESTKPIGRLTAKYRRDKNGNWVVIKTANVHSNTGKVKSFETDAFMSESSKPVSLGIGLNITSALLRELGMEQRMGVTHNHGQKKSSRTIMFRQKALVNIAFKEQMAFKVERKKTEMNMSRSFIFSSCYRPVFDYPSFSVVCPYLSRCPTSVLECAAPEQSNNSEISLGQPPGAVKRKLKSKRSYTAPVGTKPDQEDLPRKSARKLRKRDRMYRFCRLISHKDAEFISSAVRSKNLTCIVCDKFPHRKENSYLEQYTHDEPAAEIQSDQYVQSHLDSKSESIASPDILKNNISLRENNQINVSEFSSMYKTLQSMLQTDKVLPHPDASKEKIPNFQRIKKQLGKQFDVCDKLSNSLASSIYSQQSLKANFIAKRKVKKHAHRLIRQQQKYNSKHHQQWQKRLRSYLRKKPLSENLSVHPPKKLNEPEDTHGCFDEFLPAAMSAIDHQLVPSNDFVSSESHGLDVTDTNITKDDEVEKKNGEAAFSIDLKTDVSPNNKKTLQTNETDRLSFEASELMEECKATESLDEEVESLSALNVLSKRANSENIPSQKNGLSESFSCKTLQADETGGFLSFKASKVMEERKASECRDEKVESLSALNVMSNAENIPSIKTGLIEGSNCNKYQAGKVDLKNGLATSQNKKTEAEKPCHLSSTNCNTPTDGVRSTGSMAQATNFVYENDGNEEVLLNCQIEEMRNGYHWAMCDKSNVCVSKLTKPTYKLTSSAPYIYEDLCFSKHKKTDKKYCSMDVATCDGICSGLSQGFSMMQMESNAVNNCCEELHTNMHGNETSDEFNSSKFKTSDEVTSMKSSAPSDGQGKTTRRCAVHITPLCQAIKVPCRKFVETNTQSATNVVCSDINSPRIATRSLTHSVKDVQFSKCTFSWDQTSASLLIDPQEKTSAPTRQAAAYDKKDDLPRQTSFETRVVEPTQFNPVTRAKNKAMTSNITGTLDGWYWTKGLVSNEPTLKDGPVLRRRRTSEDTNCLFKRKGNKRKRPGPFHLLLMENRIKTILEADEISLSKQMGNDDLEPGEPFRSLLSKSLNVNRISSWMFHSTCAKPLNLFPSEKTPNCSPRVFRPIITEENLNVEANVTLVNGRSPTNKVINKVERKRAHRADKEDYAERKTSFYRELASRYSPSLWRAYVPLVRLQLPHELDKKDTPSSPIAVNDKLSVNHSPNFEMRWLFVIRRRGKEHTAPKGITKCKKFPILRSLGECNVKDQDVFDR